MFVRMAKRVLLLVAVNILIVVTLSLVLQFLGVHTGLRGNQIELGPLAAFCLVWGFGASFISLALSRVMARWMMGVQIVDPRASDSASLELLELVHSLARRAGITTMPQVGVYESPELNAFATGPTRNRALVAVSSGLLQSMNREQIEGVLAHEIAHVANGDMVTMTLLQGVVNAFVMFLARIVAFVAGQFVAEERRPIVQLGIILVMEMGLGLLGMLVVAAFSRHREFKADAGGAHLVGPVKVIAALKGLRRAQQLGHDELVDDGRSPALASLKICSRAGGLVRWLSTHPELDERIDRLEEMRLAGPARFARSRPALWAS